MLKFVGLLATPVFLVLMWFLFKGELPFEYAAVILFTILVTAFLIFSRINREMVGLARRLEQATETPLRQRGISSMGRSGILPYDELLLSMQQYKRVLQSLLKDAKSHQQDAMLLFDMLPNPVLVLDSRRQISRSNVAAKEFFDTDHMQGDLTTYLRHPNLLKAVEAAFKGHTENERVEFELAGSVSRHIAAYVVNLEGEGGEDLRVILTVHDLTRAKKTEQMRVDFVANASHELRTPLAILIGAIETLQGPASKDEEARQRFLGMMHVQGNRMSQLIDDLLSLSQIEMSEHERPSEPVNINDLLQSVAHMLSVKANELGKGLQLNLQDDVLFAIGEKKQLYQVFINLVDNALKYSREDTTVTINLFEEEGEINIAVEDQGEGISADHLPRLTERFYRVDSDRSREMGGTGLGLAIVKHIVSRHRGHLDIDSVLGEGSTFTVRLPKTTSTNG
ncbi:GHKL domain-containing protein [Sneathiella sp. P13V-1]|uniref:ATP-binding protein n=1 Tax=Sneathiella sp. P13V-1 TaxID=2697366 RepID=UPI00187B62B7|nr:ATP-binding protein [Sneathiella sp. P13V-1]MBE7637213.1 GHKL domain-containing protein [Sneathiella sp. P13V-1]